MSTGVTNVGTIRDWLLGRLPEHEAEKLETQLLADEQFSDEVSAVEDELFDELASGRMPEADRTAFAARRRNPGDRKRLVFAAALREVQPANVIRPARFARRSLLAAAAVLALFVTALAVMSRRDDGQPLERPVAETRTSEPAPVRHVPPPVVRPLEVAIVLGTVRSDAHKTIIDVPAGDPPLSLRIEIDPKDVHDSYRIELRPPSGDPLLLDDVHAVAARGTLALNVSVSSDRLTSRSYELAVLGRDDGLEEPLGFETIEIRRPSSE